ncbi:hypothetical protein ACJZ2D_006763 [Fusarium nematophilum]
MNYYPHPNQPPNQASGQYGLPTPPATQPPPSGPGQPYQAPQYGYSAPPSAAPMPSGQHNPMYFAPPPTAVQPAPMPSGSSGGSRSSIYKPLKTLVGNSIASFKASAAAYTGGPQSAANPPQQVQSPPSYYPQTTQAAVSSPQAVQNPASYPLEFVPPKPQHVASYPHQAGQAPASTPGDPHIPLATKPSFPYHGAPSPMPPHVSPADTSHASAPYQQQYGAPATQSPSQTVSGYPPQAHTPATQPGSQPSAPYQPQYGVAATTHPSHQSPTPYQSQPQPHAPPTHPGSQPLTGYQSPQDTSATAPYQPQYGAAATHPSNQAPTPYQQPHAPPPHPGSQAPTGYPPQQDAPAAVLHQPQYGNIASHPPIQAPTPHQPQPHLPPAHSGSQSSAGYPPQHDAPPAAASYQPQYGAAASQSPSQTVAGHLPQHGAAPAATPYQAQPHAPPPHSGSQASTGYPPHHGDSPAAAPHQPQPQYGAATTHSPSQTMVGYPPQPHAPSAQPAGQATAPHQPQYGAPTTQSPSQTSAPYQPQAQAPTTQSPGQASTPYQPAPSSQPGSQAPAPYQPQYGAPTTQSPSQTTTPYQPQPQAPSTQSPSHPVSSSSVPPPDQQAHPPQPYNPPKTKPSLVSPHEPMVQSPTLLSTASFPLAPGHSPGQVSLGHEQAQVHHRPYTPQPPQAIPTPLPQQVNAIQPPTQPVAAPPQQQSYHYPQQVSAPGTEIAQPGPQVTSPPAHQQYNPPPPPPANLVAPNNVVLNVQNVPGVDAFGQPTHVTNASAPVYDPSQPQPAGQQPTGAYQPAGPASNIAGAGPGAPAGPPGAQSIPQYDPMASLSSQMNNLNVQGATQAPPINRKPINDDGPRGPPLIRATGDPDEVISCCPESRVVSYPLTWYRIPDIPEYPVCSRCHADHIVGTYLAHHFEKVQQPEGTEYACGFWRPRIKEVLWPQAARSNDITALKDFMKKRLEIKPCKGRAAVTGNEGFKWYSMAQNEINGFVTCEACYEDRVVGTAFESRFSPSREHPAEEKWECDMCIPYIQQAVVKMAKENDWAGFVAAAQRRIELPACDGQKVRNNTRNWFIREDIEGLHVCEACYLDKVALTRFANEFVQHVQATGFDAFLQNLGVEWACNLHDSAISMTVALEAALYQRNPSVFFNAAKAITTLVPCTKHGIIRGNWWTVAGGCPEVSICEACYKGILETAGVAQFFEKAERDQTIDIFCTFCPATPRFSQFATKYNEALNRGVFSYYSDFVKKWAGVPVCPGIKHRQKTTWWGYGEALFCQDCYLSFVADTSLAEHIPVKGVFDERPLCCQIWSPRMRKMWLEVCAAGPPGSPESEKALDEFRAFGTRRMQVYNATVPQIEMIHFTREMKMMNAMHQGQLSIMYQGMNSMAAVSGTTDGYLHGNSSIGYYETEHGATSAQMMNNMQAGMADANRPDEWMQLAQLQAQWMEVE